MNKKKILKKKPNYQKMKNCKSIYKWLNYYNAHYKNVDQYRHVIRTKWGQRRLNKNLDKIMEEE